MSVERICSRIEHLLRSSLVSYARARIRNGRRFNRRVGEARGSIMKHGRWEWKRNTARVINLAILGESVSPRGGSSLDARLAAVGGTAAEATRRERRDFHKHSRRMEGWLVGRAGAGSSKTRDSIEPRRLSSTVRLETIPEPRRGTH